MRGPGAGWVRHASWCGGSSGAERAKSQGKFLSVALVPLSPLRLRPGPPLAILRGRTTDIVRLLEFSGAAATHVALVGAGVDHLALGSFSFGHASSPWIRSFLLRGVCSDVARSGRLVHIRR